MNPKRVWQCNECGEKHECEEWAYECCRPSVSEVWQCSECKEVHDEELDARFCCAQSDQDVKETEEETWLKDYQASEAAGQMRLTME